MQKLAALSVILFLLLPFLSLFFGLDCLFLALPFDIILYFLDFYLALSAIALCWHDFFFLSAYILSSNMTHDLYNIKTLKLESNCQNNDNEE